MLNIVNCEQRSPEWFAVRDLKMTASHANTIQANGKGLITYVETLVYEYKLFTKYGVREEGYKNSDMQRGNDLEDEAISLYSFENGIEITKVGFVIYDEYSGCSPDGFAGEKGLVECKTRNNRLHFELLETGVIDNKALHQMQMQLMICKKEWCDFISYNPNFGANSLFQKRIYPDFDMFAKIGRGLKTGTELIKQLIGA